jgi:undecaprenyl phosphate N,N'-diacetylbacillosamine 1-phosphate transferase
MYRKLLKPASDFIIALVLLILTSPILLIVAVLLTVVNRGSPFFFQVRPGKKERLFKIIKFKTMNNKKDIHGNLLPDHERLTGLGRFIRKTSIDELPQLVNVLKGDMSLIGPRPLLPQYLPLYNEVQRRRHEVKPGIVGWAQVNGRNAISWQQKFDYDVYYVDHVSLALDLKIAMKAFVKVFRAEGVNSSDQTTMEKFIGN